jgi:type I restriction enzyme, S subunit
MTQPTSNFLRSTPLGLIAAEWPLGAVGDFVAELKAGVSVNAFETEQGCAADEVGVLKSGAVLEGRFFPRQHKVVVPSDRGRVATSVRADRIIISRMNTPALVGESGYVEEDAPHLFLPDRLWQTEPSNEPHSQRWLSYWLQHPTLRMLIAAAATGTSNSMKNISKETVLSLPVPRTPLDEQTKIAAILEAMDDKLDVIARQIEATRTLKQGLMQTLFSRGVGTQDANGRWLPHVDFKDSDLGEIPAGWEVVPQGSAATFFNGRAYKLTEWEETGTPVIRLQNLTGSGDKYYYSNLVLPEHQYVLKGDLLFMWSATFGPYIWWGDKAIYHYHIWKIGCSERLDKGFMYYSLLRLTAAMKGKTHGSTMMHLTKAGMEKNPMVLPPIEEQVRIAEVLSSVDSKIELLTTRLSHIQTLKRGLMQKLLTGEWRVKVGAELAA